MSPGAPRFYSFRCSGEQSRKDKRPGCCPKPPQSATPYVHTSLAAITLFGEEPISLKCRDRCVLLQARAGAPSSLLRLGLVDGDSQLAHFNAVQKSNGI